MDPRTSTRTSPQINGIVIKLKPTQEPSAKAAAQTLSSRVTLQAASITSPADATALEANPDPNFPQAAEELRNASTALMFYVSGVNPENLLETVEKSPLTPPQKESLRKSARILEAFQEDDPKEAFLHADAAGAPQVTIHSTDAVLPVEPRDIVLETTSSGTLQIHPETPVFPGTRFLADHAQNAIKKRASEQLSRVAERAGITTIVKQTGKRVAEKAAKTAVGKTALKIAASGTLKALAGIFSGGTGFLLLLGFDMFGAALKKLQKGDSDSIMPLILGAGIITLSPAILTIGLAGLLMKFAFIEFLRFGTLIVVILIAFLLGSGLLYALIINIINNSTFVVPYGKLSQNADGTWTSLPPGGSPFDPGGTVPGSGYNENAYMIIEKIASADGQNGSFIQFENDALPEEVSYTLRITVKGTSLTDINVKYSCLVYRESGSQNCPPNYSLPAFPATLQAGEIWEGTFTSSYDTSYKDSSIQDTFEVTVNADGDVTTLAASATVLFGSTGSGCYVLDSSWSEPYKSRMQAAVSTLTTRYAGLSTKVCSTGNNLRLEYAGSGGGGYWGYYRGSYIQFFSAGLGNEVNALYILAHESAHALADRVPTLYAEYLKVPGILNEVPRCFYSYSSNLIEERWAEAIAYYTIPGRCSLSKYPLHKSFVSDKIY